MSNPEVDKFLGEVLGSKRHLGYFIDSYALCAQSEGKSHAYIALVTTSARLFMRFLEERELSTDIGQIDAEHIRAFIRQLQSVDRFSCHPFVKHQHGGLSGHTVNAYMRCLRAFWSWLHSEGIIRENIFGRVKIPKAPKKITPTFSEQQIRDLLAQVDTSSPEGYRNYTIILLLLDAMIRVSELTGCRMDDLELEGRCLKVRGKGSKERVVPFGKTVQKALWKYTTLYRPEPYIPQRDMLFLTSDGRPMTKNRIEVIIKTYGNKAGIDGVRVSPHTFRHTGAVNFLRNGGDLFSLQMIMGHSSLEVLRGYVNLSQADLSRVQATASPLDNLGLAAPRTRRIRK